MSHPSLHATLVFIWVPAPEHTHLYAYLTTHVPSAIETPPHVPYVGTCAHTPKHAKLSLGAHARKHTHTYVLHISAANQYTQVTYACLYKHSHALCMHALALWQGLKFS